MASTRKHGSKWYYRITVPNGDGTKHYIERGSFKTKKEAYEAGLKAEDLLKNGENLQSRKYIPFNFLAQEWLENSESKYKQSTIQGYRKELKSTILPYLGERDIKGISSRTCQQVLDQAVKQNHTRNRLSRVRACMSQCFKYAVKMGYLKESPMTNVSLPEIRSVISTNLKPPREMRALPKEEIAAIFNRFPEGSSDYIPLLLGYKAGLRLGEAFGLFVEDFDPDTGVLHLRRQIQYDEPKNQLYLTDLKWCRPGTGRDIKLDSATCLYLTQWIKKLLAAKTVMNHKIYYVDDAGYVNQEQNGRVINFLNVRLSNGTYISPRTIQHVGRVIHGKEGKFDYVDPNWDFHALRHTHASECIAAGMSPVSVQKRLGHKNLATTYRYYIHETEAQAEESELILENLPGWNFEKTF